MKKNVTWYFWLFPGNQNDFKKNYPPTKLLKIGFVGVAIELFDITFSETLLRWTF